MTRVAATPISATSRLKISSTALLLSCAIFFAAAFPNTGRADPWNDMRMSAGEIKSVRGEFTQYRHMKILARPLVSEGSFFFQGPNSLRWEYRSPVPSILLMHNGMMKRFIQKNGDLVEDALANLQSMQVVVQEITNWVKGRFDENPAFTPTLEPGRKLALVPNEKSLEAYIERIEIELSERPGVIESVTVFESRDSFTRLEFDQVTLNQPIEESLFRQP